MHLPELLASLDPKKSLLKPDTELPVSLGPDAFPNPQFGRGLLKEFMLNQELTYLNHGSYGALSHAVFDVLIRWRKIMERNPYEWQSNLVVPYLWETLRIIAPRIGANPSDVAFVTNATTGVNTVLNSLRLEPDEKILTLQVVYQTIGFSIERAESRYGAKMVKIPVDIPLNIEKVLQDFENAIDDKVKLLLIDHINSPYSFILPLERFIEIAHKHNILVLVDGAHAVGQIPLDMNELGADFYTGNFHKWFFCGAGCSFLWVHPKHQDKIWPNVISWGYKDSFSARFIWNGTQDHGPYLAASAAAQIFDRLGGQSKVNAYNNELALQAAVMLKDSWQTELSAPLEPGRNASMYTIRVPPFKTAMAKQPLTKQGIFLGDTLREKYKIEVPVLTGTRSLWVRISAQVYNEFGDYLKLRDAVRAITQPESQH
jgi:isopenicillin-N epimerase